LIDTWTESKNRRNVRLHGIAFVDAVRISEGPTVERVDDRFDYGERRIYALGLVNGLEITVVYTDRKMTSGALLRRGGRSHMNAAATGGAWKG
jgi:uncharacterized DUF497 family protein